MTELFCNCVEQIARGSYQKPNSTALVKAKPAFDGYYEGYTYICNVCQTVWFCGESHTESEYTTFWTPADDDMA